VRHRQKSGCFHRRAKSRIFAAALFRSIWGAEPGRLAYLNRPSFFGEILCCWRPRWIPGTKKSPMHAYAWYVWRKEPWSGPSLKVRVGKSETHGAVSSEPANARLTAETKPFRGRKTSQSAYIALMRSTTAASTWIKPLAPIALHRPSCRVLEQRRGNGVIGQSSAAHSREVRPRWNFWSRGPFVVVRGGHRGCEHSGKLA